jgi:hypothetical protein
MLATTLDNTNRVVQEERPLSGKMLALLIALSLLAVFALTLVLLYPFSMHWAVVALVSVVVASLLLIFSIGPRRKLTQSRLLVFAVSALSVGMVGIIFYLIFPGYGIFNLALGMGGVLSSFLILSLYAWSSSRLNQDSKTAKMLNSGGAIIQGVLFVSITWLILLSPLNDFFMNRPGQAAPWSEQLSIAQREATRADGDSVLSTVMASPRNGINSNYDTPLKSQFIFESPSGSDPSVVLHEIAPDLTDQLYADNGQSYVQSQTDFEELRKSASAVQISASEALARVKPEALALERERGVHLHPASINLQLRGRSTAMDARIPGGLPAVWEVTLRGLNPYVVQVKYWVNAATGEIVNRDYGELESGVR